MQNNQDLYWRIGNLESLPSNQTIRKAASLTENQGKVEDDASTIRPKKHATDPILRTSEPAVTAVKRYTFEQDLRQSKVYSRARRRMSLDSLQSSAAPSFGWSCLSETSLANVSDVSVISLPISASEITNAQHYAWSSTKQEGLNRLKSREIDTRATELRNDWDEQEIAVLGQQVFDIQISTR